MEKLTKNDFEEWIDHFEFCWTDALDDPLQTDAERTKLENALVIIRAVGTCGFESPLNKEHVEFLLPFAKAEMDDAWELMTPNHTRIFGFWKKVVKYLEDALQTNEVK